MRVSRRGFLAAAALNTVVGADLVRNLIPDRAPAPAPDADTHPRVVVLGPDGIDFRWLNRLLDEDAGRPRSHRRLPNLGRLRDEGAFHPLRSEIPPESPVAWASLLTGVNPGRHGILDFVRPGKDYQPENGLVDVHPMRLAFGCLPVRPPLAQSRLAAPTFLEHVHAAGYPVLGLRQPLLFPAPHLAGARLLSGLGTPDLAGGSGFYTVWSSRIAFPDGTTVFGGTCIPLEPGDQDHRTWLPGPFDPALPREANGAKTRARLPLRFEITKGAGERRVAIHLDGRVHEVAEGAQSPFFPVTFQLATFPPIHVRGHVRFEVKRLEPLTVLGDPVNLYAPDPPMPLTSPPGYGRELWNRYGPFETLGWAEQTFALNDGYQDDRAFLDDLLQGLEQEGRMLLGEIQRGGRCVFQVFTATDRAFHCFYRYYDPDHPARAAGLVEGLDPIGRVLECVDRIVGNVRALLDPEDLLIVCSDHGFQSWRWGVNLNRWLLDRGYLRLRGSATTQNLHAFFSHAKGESPVDWSGTRAFAMGLGQIYLNVRDRESEGIVDPGEAEDLARRIRDELLALRNPFARDDRPITDVRLLRDLYRGPHVKEAADIQVCFGPGYRVSWQTALLGGQDRAVFEENQVPWSGDHCSIDVRNVPGILLVNRAVAEAPPDRPHHVRDIAATVLEWFGLDTSDLEGRPLPFA